MNFNVKSLAVFGALSVMAMSAGATFAQEPSEAHIKAARSAISATRATESFDSILLRTSQNLKNQLSANNPDQAGPISDVVDNEAIALAPRRGDLEGEAARLFANSFSEEELSKIAEFFGSEAGKKYLDNTPILARELSKAARVWANGITRDLATNVNKKLSEEAN